MKVWCESEVMKVYFMKELQVTEGPRSARSTPVCADRNGLSRRIPTHRHAQKYQISGLHNADSGKIC